MNKDHDQDDKITLQHPTSINKVPNFMRRFQKLQLNVTIKTTSMHILFLCKCSSKTKSKANTQGKRNITYSSLTPIILTRQIMNSKT